MKFDPSRIQLGACDLLHFNLQSHMLIYASPMVSSVDFDLRRAVAPALDINNILVLLYCHQRARYLDAHTLAECTAIYRFGFEVENLKELFEISDDGVVTSVDPDLVATLTSISISTARGLLKSAQAGTVFSSFLLPVLPAQVVAELAFFDPNAFMPAWSKEVEEAVEKARASS